MFFASMLSLMGDAQTVRIKGERAKPEVNPVNQQIETLSEVYTEELQATRELSDASARFEFCYEEIRNLIVLLRESEPGSHAEEAMLKQIKSKREEIRTLKREMDVCYRAVKFSDTGDGHSIGPAPEVPLFFDSDSVRVLN